MAAISILTAWTKVPGEAASSFTFVPLKQFPFAKVESFLVRTKVSIGVLRHCCGGDAGIHWVP